MENFFTFFIWEVSRRARRKPSQPVPRRVRRWYEKHAKSCAAEAEKAGRKGAATCSNQTIQFTSEVSKSMSDDLMGTRTEKAQAEAKLRQTEAAIEGYDADKAAKSYSCGSRSEREDSRTKLSGQMESAEHELHLAQNDADDKADALQVHEARYGQVPPKPWGKYVANSIFVISAMVDSPFSISAAIHDLGLPPALAWLVGIALAIGIAFSGKLFGTFLVNGSWWAKCLAGGGGIALISAVGALRYGSGEFLITIFILVAFWILSILIHYIYAQQIVGCELKAAQEAADSKVSQALSNKKGLSGQYAGLDRDFDNKSKDDAFREHKTLVKTRNELESKIAGYDQIIDEITSIYQAIEDQGVARIQAAFERGKARRYSPNNRMNTSKAAVLIGFLTLFGTSACNENTSLPFVQSIQQPVARQVVVFLDQSASVVADKTQLKMDIYKRVIELAGLNTDQYIKGQIDVVVYPFGDLSVPQKFRERLPAGDPYALANVPARDTAIMEYKVSVWAVLDKAFTVCDKQQRTQLHRVTSLGFSKMMREKSDWNWVIIASDFIQEGHFVQLTKYSGHELKHIQDSLINLLLEDTELVNLNGTHIDMLVLSNGDKPLVENLSYRSAGLFKRMWEGKGAEVSFQRNFN